jgi:hypothetical protein
MGKHSDTAEIQRDVRRGRRAAGKAGGANGRGGRRPRLAAAGRAGIRAANADQARARSLRLAAVEAVAQAIESSGGEVLDRLEKHVVRLRVTGQLEAMGSAELADELITIGVGAPMHKSVGRR